MEIYTEEEWFDTFYPKSWGDWRTEYNASMYIKHQGVTGCLWMDYKIYGIVLGADATGCSKIIDRGGTSDILDHFFIECGDDGDEENVSWFIQPHYQSKSKKYYASVLVRKVESNLDLYSIFVSGSDDSSYTKDFIGVEDVKHGVQDIKNYGLDVISEADQKYYFTN